MGNCCHFPPLTTGELELVRSVFRRHPEVTTAILFGSRAKGTHTEWSDVNLLVTGDVDPLRAESIAAGLEELPVPCRFVVPAMDQIQHRPLPDQFDQAGITIYHPAVWARASAGIAEPGERRRGLRHEAHPIG